MTILYTVTLERSVRLTFPEDPLKIFPLRVLLSRLPISQQLSEKGVFHEERLPTPTGIVRIASKGSCSESKDARDSCDVTACHGMAAIRCCTRQNLFCLATTQVSSEPGWLQKQTADATSNVLSNR